MRIELEPIGYAYTAAEKVPRHWTVSDVEGKLEIDARYADGLRDITAGQEIVVLFHFHKSDAFSDKYLRQTPPHRNRSLGVFSICSPLRPNPIGLSVLEVLSVEGTCIHVRRVDMINGTPILDIKPFVTGRDTCPSTANRR